MSSFFTKKVSSSNLKRKPIVILGNGPSFSVTFNKYESLLSEMETLAVNNMAVTDGFQKLKPIYYVLAANTYFQADEDISDLYIEMNNATYSALEIKVDWKMTLFVPILAKKSTRMDDLTSKNKFISIVYYNSTPIEGLKSINNFLFGLRLGMPRPHNVIIPSLMNLIWSGYKEIYIVGADHSWLAEITVNENNEALVHHKHFYDENESKPLKMQDRISSARKLHEIVEKFYLSFRGYWELLPFAEKNDVKIYNASEISMVDAFERKKLEEVDLHI
ncbi:MAG: hypothetical protein ABI207_08645 [Crocinitomicaceae bacterium]